jgi:hypothetical protein
LAISFRVAGVRAAARAFPPSFEAFFAIACLRLTESFSALAFPPLDAIAARCSLRVISLATT